MKIYKIASTESDIANLKDSIRSLKDDIRDLKKDHKDVSSKVKKIDDILDRLNIGKRQITQVQNTFTELQRKIEKFEVIMQEWKNFKKDMNTSTRMEVEKKTKGQITASNNLTAGLRQPRNIYDIYAVSGANKKLINSGIAAYSEKQALVVFYSAGNLRVANDYRQMGWVIKAYLNKEKTQENMNKYNQVKERGKEKEESIQDMWWNKY